MTRDRRRLLISARDPGAAHNIAVIARSAQSDSRFDVTVVGDGPGYSILRDAGLPAIEAGIGNIDPRLKDDLARGVRSAVELIDRFRPDAMLTGLSGPDIGIDETLLVARGKLQAYSLQDFWGHVNCAIAARADLYFVADEEAAAQSERLHGVKTMVSGSPKFATYEVHDPDMAHRTARQCLAVEGNRPLVCIFGQALSTIRPVAWQSTMVAFVRAVEDILEDPVILYRPHPREEAQGVRKTLDALSEVAGGVAVIPEESTETWLAACDVMGTCYSNCGYDLAFLNRFSNRPLGVLIYMNYEPEIRNFYRQVANFDTIPVSEMSLTLEARTRDDVVRCVAAAVDPQTRAAIWDRCKSSLPDPHDAAAKILDRIAADQRESGRTKTSMPA
jgi:hypothetical protein